MTSDDLQRVERALSGKAFDRTHDAAVGLHREHEARANWIAVNDDSASPANAHFATDIRAGQAQFVANEIRKEQARFHIRHGLLVIHPTTHFHGYPPPL